MIFHPYELFHFIKAPEFEDKIDYQGITNEMLKNKTGFFESENITVTPMITTFGACYTITVHSLVPSKKALFVKINMADKKYVSTYIHKPGNFITIINPSVLFRAPYMQYALH